MNLTLLLTDTFTAIVWEQYVEVNLYRPGLMHYPRQGLSIGQCIGGEPEVAYSCTQTRLQ